MPLDENGRRKSLRNLMGLEPNLPGTIGADDGLQEGASPAPFRPMHGSAPFMTKPSYKIVRQSQRQRQPSFRTQMKNEEAAALNMFAEPDNDSPAASIRSPGSSAKSIPIINGSCKTDLTMLSHIFEADGTTRSENGGKEGGTADDESPSGDKEEILGSPQGTSPRSGRGSRRRSSIRLAAAKTARKLRNISKLKTVVKILGLQRRVNKAAGNCNGVSPVDGGDGGGNEEEKKERKEAGTSMKKVAGVLRQKSVELSFSSKKRKNGGSRRVLFNHNASKKEQKDMRQRIDARKHENLVDQLKLRKKTVASQDIKSTMNQLSKAQVEQFEETKLCGYLPVWHPTHPLLRNWDLLVAILVLSQLLIVPYQIAGFPGGESVESVNVYIDIIFFIDIFVQFNLAIEKGEQGYYGDDTELITDRGQIAQSYLRGWFAIDLLAISPLFIYFASLAEPKLKDADTTNLIKLVKASRLPRLFRLIRIFRVLRTLNMRSKQMQWFMYSRYSYLFSVFSLIFSLLCIVHIFACFWYLTSQQNIAQRFNILVRTWVPPFNSDGSYDEDFSDLYTFDGNTTTFKEATYVQSLHQAILLIMGESMDNETDTEIWVSSFLMIIGAILMAIVFGEVSMYITNFYASTNMFQKKMTDLYESMEALGLPQNLQERIHLFYKYVWDEHHSIDGRPAILTFVPELSTNLAKEIYLYLFSDMITKVPMFHNRPADVVQHLVLAVQTLIFMPKDYVIVKGEFGQEMFFIQSGKCDVIIEVTQKVDAKKIVPQSSKFNFKHAMKKVGKATAAATTRMRERSTRGSIVEDDSGWQSGRDSEVRQTASNRDSTRVEMGGDIYRVVEKVVKELETGSYFGEIALVTDSRRTASIRSRTFTELLVLNRNDFNRITENNQEDRLEMMNQIKSRYDDKAVKSVVEKTREGLSQEELEAKAHQANLQANDFGGLRGSGLQMPRESTRRASFMQEHLGVRADAGGRASTVDHEMADLKNEMMSMNLLLVRMHGTIEEMDERDKKRKKKDRSKKKKIRQWKKNSEKFSGDEGEKDKGKEKEKELTEGLDYLGHSLASFVETDSSKGGDSDSDFNSNAYPNQGSEAEDRDTFDEDAIRVSPMEDILKRSINGNSTKNLGTPILPTDEA